MKLRFTSYPALLLAAAMLPTTVMAETYEFDETFDDLSHFELSEDGSADYLLPKGWAAQSSNYWAFSTFSGSMFSASAQSGSRLLSCLDSSIPKGAIVYAPGIEMKGGTKQTLTFYVYAPGGNPASVRNYGYNVLCGKNQNMTDEERSQGLVKHVDAAAITNWTEVTCEMTPSEDGVYYWAIEVIPGPLPTNNGYFMLDSFTFAGTSPEAEGEADLSTLEPDDAYLEDCFDLPYEQTFSNAEDYDGTSYVPKGWVSYGSNIWRTASLKSLPPVEGSYYLISPQTVEGERDEVAFTPFFNLTAGKEYTIRYYSHISGNEVAEGVWRNCAINFTIGTEQDSEFHLKLHSTNTRNLDDDEWTLNEIKVTPLKDGPYCFGLAIEGPEASGWVAVDHFLILAEGEMPRPKARFTNEGYYSLYTSALFTYENVPVRFYNLSTDAESVKWEAEGCTINTLPDGSADILFPRSGEYTVTLTATNARGSRSDIKTFNVEQISEIDGVTTCFLTYNPGEAKMYDRGATPTIGSDPYDYISGYNHFYRELAEKVTIPKGYKINISQLSLRMADLNYRNMTEFFNDQRIQPFSLIVYGADNEGNIDETNELYRMDTIMRDVFGGTGMGEMSARGIDIELKEIDELEGTFYIVFKFADTLDVDDPDKEHPNLGRSWYAHNVVRHAHETTSLYVKPTSLPEGVGADAVTGKWQPIDALVPEYKGMGNAFYLWATVPGKENGMAINTVGEIVFAARFTGDALQVSGTTAGEWIAVYDLTGRRVAVAQAHDSSVTINADFAPGVYVVKGNKGTTKVMR